MPKLTKQGVRDLGNSRTTQRPQNLCVIGLHKPGSWIFNAGGVRGFAILNCTECGETIDEENTYSKYNGDC